MILLYVLIMIVCIVAILIKWDFDRVSRKAAEHVSRMYGEIGLSIEQEERVREEEAQQSKTVYYAAGGLMAGSTLGIVVGLIINMM